MDDRRFDELTRVFASGVSRRSLVKWLAGAVGGVTVASATHGESKAVGVGGTCTTNADCDPFLLCVENAGVFACQVNCQTGVDCSTSGDPNCCSRCCGGCNASGSCSAACSVEDHRCPGTVHGQGLYFGCCSGLECSDTSGVCEAACTATGDTCADGSECCSQACDPNGNTCCEGLGAACPGSDCCGALTCVSGFCCAPEDMICGSTAACCGDLVCSSGTCQALDCTDEGFPCTQDTDCCETGLTCNLTTGQCSSTSCLASDVTNPDCGGSSPPVCCETNAIYNPTNCQCRVLCQTGVSCLSDANCDGDEWCSGGCCVPCLADGEGVFCATEQACCSHNCTMNNCGCRSIQSDCTEDSQCCSGICSTQEPRVCLPPDTSEPTCSEISEDCDYDEDCCDDLQCLQGSCGYHSACGKEKAACNADHPCCKGYACVDGYCKLKKHPRPPKPGSNEGADSVDTLPSTGTGPDSDSTSAIGGLIAGGAAAAAAAWLLRDDSDDESASGTAG